MSDSTESQHNSLDLRLVYLPKLSHQIRNVLLSYPHIIRVTYITNNHSWENCPRFGRWEAGFPYNGCKGDISVGFDYWVHSHSRMRDQLKEFLDQLRCRHLYVVRQGNHYLGSFHISKFLGNDHFLGKHYISVWPPISAMVFRVGFRL